MIVRQNLKAIAQGISTYFGQTDGVEPIVWSIAANGAGGSINADGLYTAPTLVDFKPKSFVDTIIATDADGTIATAKIMVLPVVGLIANIIQEEMGLADNQITLYQQKFNIPKDEKVYVSVGQLTAKPIGTSRTFDAEGAGYREQISTSWRMICYVEISSSSNLAFLRKEEIIAAINSTYAEQMMEANSFKLAKITTNFTNLSREEGPGIPYRFNITFPVFYSSVKVKEVPYFDQFDNTQLTVES